LRQEDVQIPIRRSVRIFKDFLWQEDVETGGVDSLYRISLLPLLSWLECEYEQVTYTADPPWSFLLSSSKVNVKVVASAVRALTASVMPVMIMAMRGCAVTHLGVEGEADKS
jgi:hypothetical protein